MPNENTKQHNHDEPQKQAERDRAQQEHARAPKSGSNQPGRADRDEHQPPK